MKIKIGSLVVLALALTGFGDAPNRATQVAHLLSALEFLDQRSDADLREFDQSLSGPGDAPSLSAPSYARLLAARAMIEERSHLISEDYENALRSFVSASGPSPGEARIVSLLARWKRNSDTRHSAVQQSLFAKLRELEERVASEAGLSRHDLEEKFLQPLLDRDIPGARRLSELEREELLEDHQELARELADTLKKAWDREGFEAFSGKIEPGTGPKGNLIGTEFPRKTWAVTYDDGPHPSRTLELLDTLDQNGVKATFFVLAELMTQHQGISREARDRGHGLANHSYTHPQLTKLGSAGLDREIRQSTEDEAAVWNQRPEFFRCPYGLGMNTARIRQVIAEEKMIHVFWSVDSLDWKDRNPRSVLDRVMKQVDREGRGIVLFHDINAQTLEASKLLFPILKEREYRIVTLPEIVEELNR